MSSSWADKINAHAGGRPHDEQRARGECFYSYGERLGQNVAMSQGPPSAMRAQSDRQTVIEGIKQWFNEVGRDTEPFIGFFLPP